MTKLLKVVEMIYGDWKSSYAKLPRYLIAVKKTNPKIVYDIATSHGVFEGVF